MTEPRRLSDLPGKTDAEGNSISDARVFPCKNCGASLRFEPGVGRLTCSACRTQNDLPAFNDTDVAKAHEELDYRAALRQQEGNEPALEALLVQCPQCGAQTRFDPNVVASVCAFCATPLVSVKAQMSRQIQPRALVAFTLETTAAQTLFRKWIAGRWFAPNALKKTVNNVQGVRGVYVPCWTFDAETSSDYVGERGDHRTVYETRRDANGNNVTVSTTVTDWYNASGRVDVNFDDELVLASNSIPEHLASVLKGWDISGLVPFSDDFVAGFTVEAYQIALEPAFDKAEQVFNAEIDSAVRRDIGGDEQRVGRVSVNYGAVSFKHILLPVWICSYLFGGRSWRVVVNGQTGAVKGDRPYSAWKIAFTILFVVTFIASIYALSHQ
ncbi:MAG: primosomal protein N' (replication factor Y) - superfamily II helicase [Gemmatimonadaceae bacterium]